MEDLLVPCCFQPSPIPSSVLRWPRSALRPAVLARFALRCERAASHIRADGYVGGRNLVGYPTTVPGDTLSDVRSIQHIVPGRTMTGGRLVWTLEPWIGNGMTPVRR